MESITQLSSINFIVQGGTVTVVTTLILLLMSIASWYFIVVKMWQVIKYKKEISAYVHSFWAAHPLQGTIEAGSAGSSACRLASRAMQAVRHHETHASNNQVESCSYDEFLARVMRRNIVEEQDKLESGLSLLASVGSVSPFVGLFGTVWGIYHALAGISASGQATLDKVAGPVGEALIMTALGLAVAIPAVLAYNAFVKANRNILANLDSFAQDLHITLTTGAPMHVEPNIAVNKQPQMHEVIA
jgi:biopolymer transport protein ExbB